MTIHDSIEIHDLDVPLSALTDLRERLMRRSSANYRLSEKHRIAERMENRHFYEGQAQAFDQAAKMIASLIREVSALTEED